MANKLFNEFPPVTTAEWEEVINKDLKGADYEKKLVWRTNEGFSVRPYYRAEDLQYIKHLGSEAGEFPYVRGTKENNNWLVRQTITVECPKEANKTALDALMRGAESICFDITTKEFSSEDMKTLLSGIELKAIEINFKGSCMAKIAELFMSKVVVDGYAKEDISASFSIDPIINGLSLKGTLCSEAKTKIKSLVEKYKEFKRVRFVTVNGDTFANCGSTIVQELALSLSVAHDYLVMLMGEGLTIDEAARTIKFNLAISSNYFMEIAKFRAGRMLWANIVSSYNPSKNCPAKMKVHATTSKFNMTVYDPYVNMLRGTTESMSAAIAGVSSIEVLPFDSIYETPTEFSSRIARNTQLLLKEESHFNQVADAAGGSYYIEKLTESIANCVWDLFKTIEEKGGYADAFRAGYIQSIISESASARRKAIATRRETLLGTNQYPNFTEKVSPCEESAKTTSKCGCKCSETPSETEVLKPFRAAEAFEAMRKGIDCSGRAPKAFMLTVGSLAFARARSQFSSNFFGCAGIECIDNTQFASAQDGVKAALASGAEIVVVCSSDDEYATIVPEVHNSLKGKAITVVAGDPACKDELIEKGITHFISVRSNVLTTLEEYKKELGL